MRILLLLVISTCLLVSRPATACSCVSPKEDATEAVSDALKKADIVFLGKAETTTMSASSKSRLASTIQTTTFYLLESWKGEKVSRVTTKIDTQCCVCGARFDAGETYLVFGYKRDDSFYTTSICSLTSHSDHADEYLAILRGMKAEE